MGWTGGGAGTPGNILGLQTCGRRTRGQGAEGRLSCNTSHKGLELPWILGSVGWGVLEPIPLGHQGTAVTAMRRVLEET